MNIIQLALMEIIHRRVTFLLAALSIVLAVAYATSALTRMRVYKDKLQSEVAALDDEIRKSMKEMGFNINILPAEQNLHEFYADDFAQKTMPFEYVQKLADSKLVKSLNHLRPALVQKVHWQEQNRQIIIMGVTGVIPWTHRSNAKKPLAEPVPSGKANVGQILAKELDINEGDQITINGVSVTVNKVYSARGNTDDITVWMDLPTVQQMLGKPGQINLIQALECNCATIDRVAEIESEISQVLGDRVQVVELAPTAIARAKARNEVKAAGERTLAEMQRNSAIAVFLISIAGTLIVGFIAWLNVRERRGEIGILRAIGMTSRKIAAIFLVKAVFIGAVGATVGYLLGIAITFALEHRVVPAPEIFLTLLFLTPAAAVIASWIPAMNAANQDAAKILAEEQ